MKNKYLNMGTGSNEDFFAPYDKMVSDSSFLDGFEFAIRAIYPNGKEKEVFVKEGKVHQILEAGMMKYGETHTQDEVNRFRLGGGFACLVSTAHETWAKNERKAISEYAIKSFASFICSQRELGIPIAEDPEVLAKEYKASLKDDIKSGLS